MKLIGVSNFEEERMNDILIAEHVSKQWGERILRVLIQSLENDDLYYPQLVQDDYELFKCLP